MRKNKEGSKGRGRERNTCFSIQSDEKSLVRLRGAAQEGTGGDCTEKEKKEVCGRGGVGELGTDGV